MSDSAGNTYLLDDADYYIAALPAEKMATLLDDGILAADSSLAGIKTIGDNYVEWMNGIQFFLTEDVPLAHGHTIYLDSPWALTSISQQQFWAGYDLTDFGDGNVKGVISVDISNWHNPGSLLGKAAKFCTAEEIKNEVWEELKKSHALDEQPLTDDMLYCWFLDPDITREQFVARLAPGIAPESDVPMSENAEPLFVAYLNTWRLRPQSFTQVANLFLASDYVRTFTSVATMEAANEAARRAVNGIIQHSGHRSSMCRLWNVTQPDLAFIFRLEDHYRYQRGLPWKGPSRLARRLTSVVARGGRVTTVARRALTRS
jgi:15-cis-phytoene desaturase